MRGRSRARESFCDSQEAAQVKSSPPLPHRCKSGGGRGKREKGNITVPDNHLDIIEIIDLSPQMFLGSARARASTINLNIISHLALSLFLPLSLFLFFE